MANDGSGTRWLSGVTHVVLSKAQKCLECTKMAQDVLGQNPEKKEFPKVAQGGLDLCLSPRTLVLHIVVGSSTYAKLTVSTLCQDWP